MAGTLVQLVRTTWRGDMCTRGLMHAHVAAGFQATGPRGFLYSRLINRSCCGFERGIVV